MLVKLPLVASLSIEVPRSTVTGTSILRPKLPEEQSVPTFDAEALICH